MSAQLIRFYSTLVAILSIVALIVMDDQDDSIAQAYGLTGTPFYVVLDGENKNLGRLSGAIGVEGLNALAALAQQSAGS